MTDIRVPTSRYLWLVSSLTSATEVERIGEEYEHFTNYDLTDASDENVAAVELSREGLEYKSMHFRDMDLELTRVFSFAWSKHGSEYWTGVMRRYIDIRQAATAARIQAMAAASKLTKQESDTALSNLADTIETAKEAIELERARIEAEEKATIAREQAYAAAEKLKQDEQAESEKPEPELDPRRGATIKKNGIEGF